MPFSQSAQISAIVGFAVNLQPRSVLDVGTGMGQYGFLLRTYLESVHLFEVSEQLQARQRRKDEWKVQIDGIEGFAGYLTPVHEYAYNRMMIGNALALLPTLPDASYELVLAIDILEHFDPEDGRRFLHELRRIASRAVLVSTPKEFHEQEVPANPLEDHRSVWTQQQLHELGFDTVLADPESWVAVARGPTG
jgi:ubiquinone/menaquinone biosynthesis C-methylase UbiE